jgi:hypothetical protein
MFGTIKKLFFWGYARNTWQYDVLCALILAFIFLTPQSWFDGGNGLKNRKSGEPTGSQEHQKPVASKFILAGTENTSVEMTRPEIERRVRETTGRADAEVLEVRKRTDAAGKIVAYEVDIR